MVQTQPSIQKPYLKEFRPIGGGKRVLSHTVRTDSGIYNAPYIEGINAVEQYIAAHPEIRGFIPNSPDIHSLFLTLPPEDRFWTGTGTIVLRSDGDGYADKRVTDPDGRPLRLQHTSVAHHGVHWRTTGPNSIMVTEPGKLFPYREIDQVTKTGMYRVAGYGEKRGVVTHFNPNNKPVAKYENAPVWVNTSLLLAPLGRGVRDLDDRERLFISLLDRYAEFPVWRFLLGSMSTDKQVLVDELAAVRQRLAKMPGYSEQLNAGLVALQTQLEAE